MADPVLLTGATGFVGRAILDALVTAGIPVHAVARRPAAPRAGVTWHRCDLLDAAERAALLRAAPSPRLIHAAWEVEHGLFWHSARNADWHATSVALARDFLQSGGRAVIGLGTCAEYDTAPEGPLPWPETRPIAPHTPYGQAKAALHADLDALCRLHGARLVWARLFHLTGPGEDRRRFVPSVVDALRGGRVATVRAAGLRRDIASTGHVARCLLALMASPAAGAFNIGAGSGRSLGDYAALVAARLGRPDLLDLRHSPQSGDPAVMLPDLSRLRAATGLAPQDAAAAIGAAL